MAELVQPVKSGQQAGGGASETHRAIETVGQAVLPHLRRVFDSHAGPDKRWTPEQTSTFIHKVQGQVAASDAAARLAGHAEVDFNAFLAYMTSTDSAISMPRSNEDLSWPLASYFISSSHNTYLSGNQLSSDSTTEAYTNVLLRGCRCVEVDVWDGDDSDVDSSASSSSEGDSPSKAKKKAERKTKLARLKHGLPDSVTTKLENTKLGKKWEEREAHKHGAAATGATAASTTTTAPTQSSENDYATPTPEVAVVEPRVLHGYTLTKEVSFRDVCVAIRESAFTVTDLPLIVSLEVHCNTQQQATMVSIMKEIWKGVLVSEPDAKIDTLPSPHELRGKILIKVKYAPPGSSTDEYQSGDDERRTSQKQKKPSKIIQDLSRMGIYTQSVSFKSWAQPEVTMPTHIFSLSEKKFLDHHEKHGMELFKHNKQYMMRAYPSGMRIGSSNLNPPIFWGYGTQVVALNWQQTDEGTMLNEGMFAGTGGYVLKPEGYRTEVASKPSASTITRKTVNLTFTFLAAQSVPLPHEDKSERGFKPYFKVELHVDASAKQPFSQSEMDGHEREGEYKARTRTYRGCQPDLEGEKLNFHGIPGLVEELTFVRFTVRDDEIGHDDLAAWACVRLDRLGVGYRFVHLMDHKGTITEGAVLVKVEKTLV